MLKPLIYRYFKLKIKYYDTPNNPDMYLEDQPECRIRVIFHDDGDIFVYYSHDPSSSIYINKVINPNHFPHMFFLSNLETIKDDEQFDYYYGIINNQSNFQGLHKDSEISGGDTNVGIVFPNWKIENAIRRQQSK